MQYVSEPGIFSLLMDRVAKEERSTASAMNILVISLVQGTAAVIVGRALTHLGYTPVLICLAIFACISAVGFRSLAARALIEPIISEEKYVT